MMDAHDTNQPLNQGELEEEKKTVEVSEAITETPVEDVTAEVQPEAAPKPATKEDVLNQLKELARNRELLQPDKLLFQLESCAFQSGSIRYTLAF